MYEVIHIKWDKKYEKEITAIYGMFKDQERKIFDLTVGADIMDIVQEAIVDDATFCVMSNDNVVGVFILEDPAMFGDLVCKVKIHAAIRRPFWGPESRVIANTFLDYLDKYYRVKKLIAEVPQCGYGVIKLLKDCGFKHEGTMKHARLYPDKNGNPKWYDELIYTKTREDL